MKDYGTGAVVAELGQTNNDWVTLGNGKRVKVVEHVEGGGYGRKGYAVLNLFGRGNDPFNVWDGEENQYLGVYHVGDDAETISYR